MTAPLRANLEAFTFARSLYEQGQLLRVIVERLGRERGVMVTVEAIQWHARREQWDKSRRNPGYMLRAVRGALTKRARALPETEAEWTALLATHRRRCACGGIIDPASGIAHHCAARREGET